MLFRQATLDGIAAGTIDRAYRRWDRPRVKVGTKQRTVIGLVEITAVEPVAAKSITARQAQQAGSASRAELLAALGSASSGRIYCIGVRAAGEDPRIALRARGRLTKAELADLTARLQRLDRASRQGEWTLRVLQLIAEKPAVRAPDLAESIGVATQPFKRNVRKLKELGLTESLDVGYRLSARGRTALKHLMR
jgi:hypothetical protein